MARVAQSEHDLLLVTRALVGQAPFEAVELLLRQPRALPDRVGPTAARLLRQTLALGSVHQLMRRGGWRRDAIVDGERVRRGRAWEMHAAPRLRFSALSMQLCRWLTSERLGGGDFAKLPGTTPTLADELLLYLACELLSPSLLTPLAQQAAVRASPLCRLAFADSVGAAPAEATGKPLEPWLNDGGALLLTALAPDLARHWIAIAQRQARRVKPEPIIAAGQTQETMTTRLLDAIDKLGRRDLGQFVVVAGAHLLRGDARQIAARLCADVDETAPLGQRAEARRAVGAPLRAFVRVGKWHEEHRLTRHFDDGYAVAQHLLHQWEPYQQLFPVAEDVLRELASLGVGTKAEDNQ